MFNLLKYTFTEIFKKKSMRTCFSIVFIFFTLQLKSQQLGIDFSSTGTGRNFTATFSKNFNKSELGFGLGYNVNSIIQPDDQNNLYHKRLFATKSLQHLNLDVFYQRSIFGKLNKIEPFVFVDVQVKYSTARSSVYIPYAYDSSIVVDNLDENILYRNHIFYLGPFLWVENYIGIGFYVEAYKNWYLKQKIGYGGYSVIGKDDRISGNYTWEFASILSIGVVYKIPK